ncbi:MAG: DUF2975 domain-containing protein [Proteobacteria bacterium]|nr:DUF2975 domain-containing protein [Pseudomonadota bacterium]
MKSTTTADVPARQDRQRRLRRMRVLSAVMAAACITTSALLTAAMAFYWAATPTRTLLSQAGLADSPATELDGAVRALAFVVAMLPLAALIYGLLSARRCFKAFVAGDVFSRRTIGHLMAFAVAIAASAILKPFAGAVLSALLSASTVTGTKTLAFHIGSDTLIALIFAGTFAIIAWVMTEAADLSDENKQFV